MKVIVSPKQLVVSKKQVHRQSEKTGNSVQKLHKG